MGGQAAQAQLGDQQVTDLITSERASSPFVATLGSRKMWLRLRGKDHEVARCTVERIMGENGWEGAGYDKQHRTTCRPGPGWSTS